MTEDWFLLRNLYSISELLETVFSTNLDKQMSIRLIQLTYFLGKAFKPGTKQQPRRECALSHPQPYPPSNVSSQPGWYSGLSDYTSFPRTHKQELCCAQKVALLSLSIQIDASGFALLIIPLPPFTYIVQVGRKGKVK